VLQPNQGVTNPDGQSKGRPGSTRSGITAVSVSPKDSDARHNPAERESQVSVESGIPSDVQSIVPGSANADTNDTTHQGNFIPAALVERLPAMYDVVGYGGIYTDVTLEAEAVMQSARSESCFQDVIRSASDWVWETDHNLNLTYVSNRIAEALETPPAALNWPPSLCHRQI